MLSGFVLYDALTITSLVVLALIGVLPLFTSTDRRGA